jgi:hypothetical protein
MTLAIQIGLYSAGLSLDVLILAVLLRGQWKRYPFVFLYVIGDFLTTVAEIPFSLHLITPKPNSAFSDLYWIDDPIMQVLVFLLVISLVYRATYQWKPRRTLLLGLVAGTLLFWGVSFLLHFNASTETGKWMTGWMRDMNFCAVILDLGLWGLLIGAREKEYKLLMVTGALGIQFTGNAIGEALRQLSHSILMGKFTAYFIVFANLACSYIWWRAFRMPDSPTSPRPVAVVASRPETTA